MGARNSKVRQLGVLVITGVLLLTSFAATRLSAWTTDDPTRVVIYEGRPGTHGGDTDGVLGTSPERDSISIDASGNLYALTMTGGELSVGPGPLSETVGSLSSITSVVTKTDVNGNLEWHRSWSGYVFGPSVITTVNSSVLVAGFVFGPVDLDPTSGTDLYTPLTDATDAVVVELDSTGRYIGSIAIRAVANKSVELWGIESTTTGEILVYGDFDGSTTFPGRAAISASGEDGFIAQLNRTTRLTDWIVTSSGIDGDVIDHALVMSDGTVNIVGNFASSSIVLTGADGTTQTLLRTGSSASFLANLNSNGVVSAVSVHQAGAWGLFEAGNNSVIVHYLTGEMHLYASPVSSTVIGNFVTRPNGAIRTADGRLRLFGYFQSSIDFDIGTGVNVVNAVNSDAFLLTLTSDYRTESVQIFSGPAGVYNYAAASTSDGGFFLSGAATAGTLNLSNTSHNGTFTSTPGMSHFRYFIRYDASGTTGTTTTTTIPAVNAPTQVSYTPGNKKATVRWSAVSGASSYVVTTGAGEVKCSTTATSCLVTGMRNGKAYTYNVFAVNGAGVRSLESRSVRVVPGFSVKTTTFAVKKKPKLSSIVTTPSKGIKRWSVVSGTCRVSGSRLVTPAKAGICRLRLTVAKRGSYPAMTTTVRISVTR